MSNIKRRPTVEVRVGNVGIGGENPVRVQSMTNTPTLDTERSVAQAIALSHAGAELVRLTAQGVPHAKNLGNIRTALRNAGITTPLVADIHFNPAAAFAAAEEVEKVRINPGNFVDPARTFKKLEYTDEEYAAELARIRERLIPFIDLCREKGTAIRLGVNHGSLSDRIMSRYGDTPAGMVESALEFLRVFREQNFDQVVISIKASNVKVMVDTVRLLVKAMDAEDMHFPLHLGVTEAGDGEDGRVKSAVGIGTLLAEGIGDTIRVSLSEDPVEEIPVAREIIKHVENLPPRVSPCEPGNENGHSHTDSPNSPILAVGVDGLGGGYQTISVPLTQPLPKSGKILLRASYPAYYTPEQVAVAASVDLGSLLLDGYGDAIEIKAPSMSQETINNLELSILQATRRRFSKTEYIACPGCGRTLFALSDVLRKIKAATSHLKGLKIGVMGCIVNGPGEMADADYGYVGAAAGCVSLYRGKECVQKNVPENEALAHLMDLIKADGRWVDPEV
ncbi:MAG: (E)-4-hydroxy-3-methylbut-2-enyl-diphosphate synthase [Muribaculaceae bacterium]|nr:(E)-4-hydroxy-3-methylbut-2-enyl-diphosphate synthase [Muribaculaceae bacterium]